MIKYKINICIHKFNEYHNFQASYFRILPTITKYRSTQSTLSIEYWSQISILQPKINWISRTNFSATNRSLLHLILATQFLANFATTPRPFPEQRSDHANESPARCIMYHRRITTVDDPRGSPAKRAIATWTRQWVNLSAKSGEPPAREGEGGGTTRRKRADDVERPRNRNPAARWFFCGFERMARLRRPPSRRRASIFMRHFRTPLNGQSNTK